MLVQDAPATGAALDQTAGQLDDVTVHIYGKLPRVGRKLGHITAVGENAPHRAERFWNG